MTALEVVGIVLLVIIGGAVAIGLLVAFLSAIASGWDH
jgi:hypothetical protein